MNTLASGRWNLSVGLLGLASFMLYGFLPVLVIVGAVAVFGAFSWAGVAALAAPTAIA